MNDNIYRNFLLNNSLAAVSAEITDGGVIATDGFECVVHEFDSSGSLLCKHSVLRPYRRLRSSPCDDYMTAVCGCGGTRIYFLDENYSETDYVDLESTYRRDCGNFGALADASSACIGSETFLVGAFDSDVFLFDMNGRRMTRLCSADNGERITDFVTTGEDIFAMATQCGRTQTVTVSDGKDTQSATVPMGYSLRMLIPRSDGIYALFGKSYIYNRIYKIYSDGLLRLPKA